MIPPNCSFSTSAFPIPDGCCSAKTRKCRFRAGAHRQQQYVQRAPKESSLMEIKEAIRFCVDSKRFVCQRMMEVLLTPPQEVEEKVNLTKTETEILKDIALGMTTKEIAEKRFSSFHTVNTHRKNIFRKLGVNNVHEATKYALRAGLVDSAEYYI